MRPMRHYLNPIAALALLAISSLAAASLPPPTPAQAAAAAAKKAAADAQAAKDKQELTASMDAITARWRSRAAQQGWHANPAIAAAPAGATPPAAGASPQPSAPPMPIKSEKAGTAPPSTDVKKKP